MAVNMLMSYAFYGRADLAAYRAKMPCGRMMIDSGAFTALSTGKAIGLDEYGEFLTNFSGVWDAAVTLDVIGDPKATHRNTKKLHDRGIPVMPVFTRGGTIAEFDAMVRDSGYVCVGGGVGMPRPVVIKRLSALQRRAEELGGGIHALGVGNLPGIRAIRPYSADSSNISGVFMFGRVVYYDGRRLNNPSLIGDVPVIRANQVHLKAAGLDMTALMKAGRHPTAAKGGTTRYLMRGMAVAYSCADEDTARLGVPVPHSIDDTSGTHMYCSITASENAKHVAELDGLMHDGEWSVPMWERYRAGHERQCRAGKLAQV